MAAVNPAKPKAAAAATGAMMAPKVERSAAPIAFVPSGSAYRIGDPRSVIPGGATLDDEQLLIYPAPMKPGLQPPWQDGGRQFMYSYWVYGTLFQNNRNNEIHPHIGASWTNNADYTVWTIKLRDNAIYQDGTPITAADVKAYWEHGAKPENIVSWGGASLSIGVILGWEELKAGDTTEAEGLRVIDDLTLEITLSEPTAGWPMYMTAWHTGLSKLSQIDEVENPWEAPIGAGPMVLTLDPNGIDTHSVAFNTAEAGRNQFWGPEPIIQEFRTLAVADSGVQYTMFENGELSFMQANANLIDPIVSDPNHPFNKLLIHTNYPGFTFLKFHLDIAPMEDLLVRKALAHGNDMETVIKGVYGRRSIYGRGLMAPGMPCHDPNARGIDYDPDLARQELADSTYMTGDNFPALFIDGRSANDSNANTAIKEYWKDNLGVELDTRRVETGQPIREGSPLRRIGLGSWIMDPANVMTSLTAQGTDFALTPREGGYPVIDALMAHAKGLELDDPERCAAFRAVSDEYLDKAYVAPMEYGTGLDFLVQPWVVNFSGAPLIGLPQMPWMYIVKH
jgi:ABC-type transport system substrate-binding protein